MSSLYWVKHPTHCYVAAHRVGDTPEGLCIFETEEGETFSVTAADARDAERAAVIPEHLRGVDDVVSMSSVSSGALLHTVRTRYAKGQIYTNVAAIVVAVNPFQNLPDEFSAEKMALYRGEMLAHLEKETEKNSQKEPTHAPHLYAVAQNALTNLQTQRPQTVLVSGESGAGKTESVKHALRYVAAACANSSTSSSSSTVVGPSGGARLYNNDNHHGSIEQRILKTNPVLEAFGNAKTARNNNSSRFGKWLEIEFSRSNKQIEGAFFVEYLLEKSRVVTQSAVERNFHIFYFLLASKNTDERILEKYDLVRDCGFYKFLRNNDDNSSSPGSYSVDNIDDEAEFAILDEALTDLDFSELEKHELYSLVAALLHLGNVNFAEAMVDGTDGCRVVNNNNNDDCREEAVALAAKHLGLSNPQILIQTLTYRTMTVGGEQTQIPLKKEVAEQVRSVLAKLIYGKVFDWIIRKLNATLGNSSGGASSSSCCMKNAELLEEEALCNNKGEDSPLNQSQTTTRADSEREVPATMRGGPFVNPTDEGALLANCDNVVEDDPLLGSMDDVGSMGASDSVNSDGSEPSETFCKEQHRSAVGSCGSSSSSLGFLDIAGFECFETNSFEQLCINLSNESLQKFFNDFFFQREMQDYAEDGLVGVQIEYPDNSDILELISGGLGPIAGGPGHKNKCEKKGPTSLPQKKNSILQLLDNEVASPKPEEFKYIANLKREFEKHPRYTAHKSERAKTFVLQHFAGEVEYNVAGWLEKNLDVPPPEAQFLTENSENSIIKGMHRELFGKNESTSNNNNDNKNNRKSLKKKFVSRNFKHSLEQLLKKIWRSEPHFIRCIKPNDEKRAFLLKSPRVFEQLLYSGTMEAVQIRQAGYPLRLEPGAFFERFRCLLDCKQRVKVRNLLLQQEAAKGAEGPNSSASASKELLEFFDGFLKSFFSARGRSSEDDSDSGDRKKTDIVTGSNIVMTGSRRIFVKLEGQHILEKERVGSLGADATVIQKVVRSHLARTRFAKLVRIRDDMRVLANELTEKRLYQSVGKNGFAVYGKDVFQKKVREMQLLYKKSISTKLRIPEHCVFEFFDYLGKFSLEHGYYFEQELQTSTNIDELREAFFTLRDSLRCYDSEFRAIEQRFKKLERELFTIEPALTELEPRFTDDPESCIVQASNLLSVCGTEREKWVDKALYERAERFRMKVTDFLQREPHLAAKTKHNFNKKASGDTDDDDDNNSNVEELDGAPSERQSGGRRRLGAGSLEQKKARYRRRATLTKHDSWDDDEEFADEDGFVFENDTASVCSEADCGGDDLRARVKQGAARTADEAKKRLGDEVSAVPEVNKLTAFFEKAMVDATKGRWG